MFTAYENKLGGYRERSITDTGRCRCSERNERHRDQRQLPEGTMGVCPICMRPTLVGVAQRKTLRLPRRKVDADGKLDRGTEATNQRQA